MRPVGASVRASITSNVSSVFASSVQSLNEKISAWVAAHIIEQKGGYVLAPKENKADCISMSKRAFASRSKSSFAT
jgi:hypothetical protein